MKTLSKLQQLSFIIRREFLAISTSYAVLLVLMGGIFVYGLLYNYMYAPNIVTDVPVAVVDNSHSELSRDFIRWLDATPQAEIFSQAMDYHEAKEWMKEGKVQGILYLPHDFEERVFRGDEAVFSLYATTDAFLYFEALQGASSRVMLAINDKYRPDEAVFLPPQGLLAVAMAKPINVEGTALYNYTEGYGSYLIPAVMMIIIFQTLLMVIGMVTGEEYHQTGIFQELEEGKLSADEFRKQLGDLCGRPLTMEETKQAWLGFFNEVNLNKLDYILELRKSYHVYILSNTNPFVMSWACSPDFSSKKKPLNDYCDKLYLSYQVGHTKPAPEIFDYMVNDCNIIPSETLFVDDGASNIQIGKELGFETFQPKNGEDWREKMTAILEK